MATINIESISGWRRFLHWTTAALVIALLILGKWMTGVEANDAEAVAASMWRFSLHKTTGIIVLAITLLRFAAIIFGRGFSHSRHSSAEVFAASMVQAYFLAALVALPLTGLLIHAYASGSAPIWLLPDDWLHAVQADPKIVELAASVHHFLSSGLIVALGLHIAGAIKHHFIDKDNTLNRMLGRDLKMAPDQTSAHAQRPDRTYAFAKRGNTAGLLVACIVGGSGALAHVVTASDGAALVRFGETTADLVSVSEASELRIVAEQNGKPFEALFEQFEVRVRIAGDGLMPDGISVDISSSSFASGLSDRDRAVIGGDWLDAESFPTAHYETVDITQAEDGSFAAQGQLTIREVSAPVAIAFTWEPIVDTNDGRVQMKGSATFDRFDVELGRGDFTSETAAGRMIEVEFDISLAGEPST